MTQTLEFPNVNDPQWPTRLVEQLLSGNLIDTGGVQFGIRFGVAAVSWTGGTSRAANTTVTHGLGRTPVAVVATTMQSAAGVVTSMPVMVTFSYAATSFGVSAVTSDAAAPATGTTINCAWIAVG